MLNRGLDKLELLRIVEAVANEKSIDKEIVIGSMESAIQKAALTKFGSDNSIEVLIDRESGDIKIQKVLDVVEKVEDTAREITLEEAQKLNPKNKDLKIGVCGEHAGEANSIKFFNTLQIDYISCSPFRIPTAKLAAAQAEIIKTN